MGISNKGNFNYVKGIFILDSTLEYLRTESLRRIYVLSLCKIIYEKVKFICILLKQILRQLKRQT